MKKILQAWSVKTLQEYINIQKHLNNEGKTFKDIIPYLKKITLNPYFIQAVKNVSSEGFIRKPIRKCPKCGGVLKLFSTATGCKWECCKTCSTQPCGYVEYIERDIEEVIKEYNGNI